MVYVVVTDIGAVELFTHDIMEAVKMVNFLKTEYDTDATILDKEEDIEYAMFGTDGLNNAWFEDYYEWFPHDAGIDIKIPIQILEQYFNKSIDALAKLEEDMLYLMCKVEGVPWDEAEMNNRVDQFIVQSLGCSDIVWDKILHGEYMVV